VTESVSDNGAGATQDSTGAVACKMPGAQSATGHTDPGTPGQQRIATK